MIYGSILGRGKLLLHFYTSRPDMKPAQSASQYVPEISCSDVNSTEFKNEWTFTTILLVKLKLKVFL
jgi:hypothetical protein